MPMIELISQIKTWLSIQDPLKKSDLIFLMGGPYLPTPTKGLELYNAGWAPYIVTTGNTGAFDTVKSGIPHAEMYAAFLREHGVPEERIIIQNRSMNTLEDITFTVPLLEEKGIPHQRIILVTRPVHQRRAYATFKKHVPETEIINISCNDTPLDDMTEKQLMLEAEKCIAEYERLVVYAEKGDIEEQNILEEIEAAARHLEKLLSKTAVPIK